MAVLQRGKKGDFRVYLESGSDFKAAQDLGLNGRDIGWTQNRRRVVFLVKEINQITQNLNEKE